LEVGAETSKCLRRLSVATQSLRVLAQADVVDADRRGVRRRAQSLFEDAQPVVGLTEAGRWLDPARKGEQQRNKRHFERHD
jgi:hypothetical protein